MAKEQPLFSESLVAAADLSTKQFTYVKLDTNGKMAAAAEADIAYGILQDKPTSGQTGNVMRAGVSKVKCAAGNTKADRGGSDDNGLFKTNATNINGQLLEDSDAANGLATISFSCMGK
jgi:hypothetical protein